MGVGVGVGVGVEARVIIKERIDSLTHSLTHSRQSFVHPLIHSHSLTFTHIHSHSLTFTALLPPNHASSGVNQRIPICRYVVSSHGDSVCEC